MTTLPLHPDITHLAVLLGTWEGDGEGHYPTIADFVYRERVSFGHVGKPFLTYQQRTWHPHEGHGMHAETGYLRPAPMAGAELVLAHPTGIVEVEEGTFDPDGGVLRLATTTVGRSGTAKEVRGLRREFRLDGGTLSYDVWMAFADVPETHHLTATLRRVS